jgi:hypothetical protein
MLMKVNTGPTCAVCGASLPPADAKCQTCGKLDMTAMRRDLVRGIAPVSVFASVIFASLALFTAIARGPGWVADLGAAIDDQFKPSVAKKK